MKRSEKLLDAIGEIDDRYIMEAADFSEERRAKRTAEKQKIVPLRRKKTAAALAGLAACAAVALFAAGQGAWISPFEAEGDPAAEIAVTADSAVTSDSAPAAVPRTAAEMPENAGEIQDGPLPYAYTADGMLPEADAPADQLAQGGTPRSAKTGAPEAPVAKVSASDIQADGSVLTCTLISEEPENTLSFSSGYYLEYLTEDGWEAAAPVAEVAWEDIAYGLEPGGSLEMSWNLEVVYGTLEGGQYRVGIPCEEQNEDGTAPGVIYVEFGI